MPSGSYDRVEDDLYGDTTYAAAARIVLRRLCDPTDDLSLERQERVELCNRVRTL